LPPLAPEEALEVTRIWSASGLASGLVRRRPFRAPHHGTSPAGLVGGGAPLRPGEVTLAHHGVLYLDELPEFRRDALEALRQPLEDGEVHVTRVRQTAILPARFTWVASMNPCPCGWHGQPGARCRCSPLQVASYLGRVSGPLLDRIDLTLEVPPVDLAALVTGKEGESSARVRERVLAARLRQRDRFGPAGPSCNAQMRPRELDRFARLGEGPRRLLVSAWPRRCATWPGTRRSRRSTWRRPCSIGTASSRRRRSPRVDTPPLRPLSSAVSTCGPRTATFGTDGVRCKTRPPPT
jgi:magnesium chelatase family protein